MPRQYHDWLTGFLEYTQHLEAPTRMYFWVGVSTIAGALRRRVWFDQASFKWYPNLYTLLVAPPGVISKTTTADLGMDLLREVPGVTFGPDVVTWQALFDAFTAVHEMIPHGDGFLSMSPLTIVAGELGTFLNTDDRQMIDQLVNLWDGRSIKKHTRMDGEQIVTNPCLNLLACTTPSWIAQNFPDYMIGGGFTSRLVFVFGDAKTKFVAYPYRHVPTDFVQRRLALVGDLAQISEMTGPFTLTDEAFDFGTSWYENFHRIEARHIDETILGGYINRKQTLVHKVAMCLSASAGESMLIDRPTLERSVKLVTELEREMPKVYSRLGGTIESNEGLKIIAYIKRSAGPVPFTELYRYAYRLFPSSKDFEDLMISLVKGQMLKSDIVNGTLVYSLP